VASALAGLLVIGASAFGYAPVAGASEASNPVPGTINSGGTPLGPFPATLTGNSVPYVFCGAGGNPNYPGNANADYTGTPTPDGSARGSALGWLAEHKGPAMDSSPTDWAAADGIISYFNPTGTKEDYQHAQTLGLGTISTGAMGAMWALAQSQAGPYVVSFSGDNTGNADDSYRDNTDYTGTVHVQGSAGPITGAVVTLTPGGGVNLSTESVTTDSAGNATFTWELPAGANFTLSGATTQPEEMYYTAKNSLQSGVGMQNVAVSGSGSGETDPEVATSFYKYDAYDPSTPLAGATVQITDTTDGSDLGTYTSTTGRTSLPSTVFGGDVLSITESATAPAGAADPNGYVLPPAPILVTVPNDGSASFSFGIANQQIVTAKTQASSQAAVTGSPVHDTIKVVGGPPAGSASPATVVATTYYLPWASATQSCADITPTYVQAYIATHPEAAVATETDTLSGTAPIVTKNYTAAAAGVITWGEKVYLAGSQTPIAFTSPGDVNEVSCEISPTVTTTLTKGAGTPTAASFADTAVITGTHNIPGVVINDSLIGPVAAVAGSCTGAAYTATQVAGQFAPIPVTKDGSYITNALSVPITASAQCVVASETIAVGGQVVPKTAALGAEAAEVGLISAATGLVSQAGGGVAINTGGPGAARRGPLAATLGGGVLLALLTLVGLLAAVRRRKTGATG
jgi:hypothetical protein